MSFNKANQAISVLILSIFLANCSSTNPGMSNTGKDEQNLETIEPSDEDQVLRLLGISTDESETTLDSVLKEKEMLGQKIENLESELDDKNSTITQLTKAIEDKNNLLAEREKLLVDLQPTKSGDISDYESAYQAAFTQYTARDYGASINSFEELLLQDMNNSLSDNCQYWIGESYYGLGEYQSALIEFEKVSNFINSNKEDAALLKIGLCYEKLNQNDSAKQTFQRLLDKYPSSEFVPLAEQMLLKYQ